MLVLCGAFFVGHWTVLLYTYTYPFVFCIGCGLAGYIFFFIFQVRSDHASFCVIAQQVNFNIEEYLINIFLFYYFLCGVCALWKLSHRLCCRADCALVRARYCLSTIGDIAASWHCILLCIEWRCRKVERVWDIVIHIIILYRYFK